MTEWAAVIDGLATRIYQLTMEVRALQNQNTGLKIRIQELDEQANGTEETA